VECRETEAAKAEEVNGLPLLAQILFLCRSGLLGHAVALAKAGGPAKNWTATRRKKSARFGVAKQISGVTRCPVMADLIKPGELKERMKKVPEWELEKKHIERTFEFDDFADAIDFVNAVAEVAEEEEHHPDIDIRYNKVRLVLSTHSKGGLTEFDFGLAERIDTLAE